MLWYSWALMGSTDPYFERHVEEIEGRMKTRKHVLQWAQISAAAFMFFGSLYYMVAAA
jgi:hypothetical protein